MLFHFFFSFNSIEKLLSQTEKQRYDGWYNNMAHPDWGSVGKFHSIYRIIKANGYVLLVHFECALNAGAKKKINKYCHNERMHWDLAYRIYCCSMISVLVDLKLLLTIALN